VIGGGERAASSSAVGSAKQGFAARRTRAVEMAAAMGDFVLLETYATDWKEDETNPAG